MGSIVRPTLATLLVVGLIMVNGWPSPVEAQGPTASQPARAALAEREVFGFLPHWELGNADGIDLDTLTTLAWFSVEAGRDGRLIRETADGTLTPGWAGWTSESFGELRDRAQASGVRVVLTVERFSWDTAGRRTTRALLGDPAARTALVDDIVEAVESAGAGGVNLDFEPLPRSVRNGFVRLVRELRTRFEATDPSLQLTFDLTPDVTSFPLGRLTGLGAAHAAVLMGYEYRTNGSRVAGSVAPLDETEDLDLRESLRRTLAKARPGEVILALPWYGRAWSTRTAEPGARTRRSDRFIAPAVALYRAAVARAREAGRRFDSRQASAWSVYPSRACEGCPLSWRQVWYDDVDSVKSKVGFAIRKRLRGVGIWALGYEGNGQELWSALRFALDGPRELTAPFGTASIARASILGEQGGRPVVGDIVELDLAASDGPTGSGVAFVRVATRGRMDAGGRLVNGTTFPAGDSVRMALPGGGPVREAFVPGSGPAPSPSPFATPSAAAEPSPGSLVGPESAVEHRPRTIRVQWRDIAGNWSVPLELEVRHQAETVMVDAGRP